MKDAWVRASQGNSKVNKSRKDSIAKKLFSSVPVFFDSAQINVCERFLLIMSIQI